ncbi:hypothetical protein [Halalkalirubrum salinum]|uniref:hypothetical protein n=1 Tax=Halalkalirubrum salinum TaxID=2563889 RepID=UPI0010FB09AB|nr:hypothetical protein [Halalkalirubrum salinum]
MVTYDHVRTLPIEIERIERSTRTAETTSDFTRWTTVFELHGSETVGRGEDVTYDTVDHEALADAPNDVFDWLEGTWTVDSLSEAVGDRDLFPTGEPERADSRHYRRWGIESAALDLALKQAETNLAAAVGRSYDPVRFVTSLRVEDATAIDRLRTVREQVPDIGFKLDPTPAWDDELTDAIAAIGGVDILDLKGWYEGTEVDQEPDPELYERVCAAFPDAIVEDAAFLPETESLLSAERDRLSFDYPITSAADIADMPIDPEWINIKPSRFGSIESLFEAIDYCEENGISMYGGGQFELDVGREQIQALASVWYPETPNDVAPGAYNDPTSEEPLPPSPLLPSERPIGFGL